MCIAYNNICSTYTVVQGLSVQNAKKLEYFGVKFVMHCIQVLNNFTNVYTMAMQMLAVCTLAYCDAKGINRPEHATYVFSKVRVCA